MDSRLATNAKPKKLCERNGLSPLDYSAGRLANAEFINCIESRYDWQAWAACDVKRDFTLTMKFCLIFPSFFCYAFEDKESYADYHSDKDQNDQYLQSSSEEANESDEALKQNDQQSDHYKKTASDSCSFKPDWHNCDS